MRKKPTNIAPAPKAKLYYAFTLDGNMSYGPLGLQKIGEVLDQDVGEDEISSYFVVPEDQCKRLALVKEFMLVG